MNRQGTDHRKSDYRNCLNSLLDRIEEKCGAFDRAEALQICAEKKKYFGYRERMQADIPLLKGISESCRRLSEESRSVRVAMQILAERGIEAFEKFLQDHDTDGEDDYNEAVIIKLFRCLDRIGVPNGRELYAVTAGILVYTWTIPAEKFGLPDGLKIFEVTGEQMDKLKEGHIEAVLKKYKVGRWGSWRRTSKDKADDFLPVLSAPAPPVARKSLVVQGARQPQGSILPNAKKKGGRRTEDKIK